MQHPQQKSSAKSTLMITAKVVKTSVVTTKNSPSQDYSQPDDQTAWLGHKHTWPRWHISYNRTDARSKVYELPVSLVCPLTNIMIMLEGTNQGPFEQTSHYEANCFLLMLFFHPLKWEIVDSIVPLKPWISSVQFTPLAILFRNTPLVLLLTFSGGRAS